MKAGMSRRERVGKVLDLAPSLEPHREARLGLTCQTMEWTETVVERPFRDSKEAPWVKDMILKVKGFDPDAMWSFAGNTGM